MLCIRSLSLSLLSSLLTFLSLPLDLRFLRLPDLTVPLPLRPCPSDPVQVSSLTYHRSIPLNILYVQCEHSNASGAQCKKNKLTDDESVSSCSRWQDVLEDLRHVSPAVMMLFPKLGSSTPFRESERMTISSQKQSIQLIHKYVFLQGLLSFKAPSSSRSTQL